MMGLPTYMGTIRCADAPWCSPSSSDEPPLHRTHSRPARLLKRTIYLVQLRIAKIRMIMLDALQQVWPMR